MKKILLFVCALICSAAMSATTWNVTVPEGTKTCYIAGEATGWKHTEMTKVDATHYTITIETDKTDKYKYCSGPQWAYEELTAEGGKVEDRMYAEQDVVAQWASIYDPGTIVSYVDITIRVKAATAPTIWWWGAGDKCPNPDQMGLDYDFNTNQPVMTAVEGKEGWYEWNFKDVDESLGVTFKLNKEDKAITAKASGCYNTSGDIIDCDSDEPIDPSDIVYVVTGASDVIFGSQWNNNSTCVLEKQADGSYAWTKEDVELTASTVQYKYLEKGTWDGWQLPAKGSKPENASFTIDKSGKYDLTFTLSADLSTQNVQVTLKEEVEVLAKIIMHGQFTGNWADTDPFAYNEDNTVATLSIVLEADKTIQFGMKFDGQWKANGAEITSTNNSTNLGEGSGDMKLITTVAGDYVFTYVVATQDLTVTYPVETAISSVENQVTATKVIRNGQVLIIRDGVAYDMMGQEIK